MADVVWFEYELVTVGDGPRIVETRPAACPNGHPLDGDRCIVVSVGELEGGRFRSWECRECGAITWGRRKHVVSEDAEPRSSPAARCVREARDASDRAKELVQDSAARRRSARRLAAG